MKQMFEGPVTVPVLILPAIVFCAALLDIEIADPDFAAVTDIPGIAVPDIDIPDIDNDPEISTGILIVSPGAIIIVIPSRGIVVIPSVSEIRG